MGGVSKVLKKAADPLGIAKQDAPKTTEAATPTAATEVVAQGEVAKDKDTESGASNSVKRKRGKSALKIQQNTGANASGSGTGVNV
jgi:hypothetical protein